MAAATLQRKAACLRSFYRHLRREGLIEHDPTAELRGPPKTKRLPKVLSREQVTKLLAQPKGSEPLALRDRALLELMYACGLRVSEAIGLELSDVDLEEGMLRARGKGSKERIVPVGRRAVSALEVYLARGRPVLVGIQVQSSLFVNHRGWLAHAPGALQDHPEPCTHRGLGRADDARTPCAIHLPRTCWREVATCARCRRCSVTPTWRPHRSIRTCRPSA